jgi:hypothetical protein
VLCCADDLFFPHAQESGSPDLPHYVEHLSQRIGTPSLIICLDSGAGNYEQLWLTTSLRYEPFTRQHRLTL